MTADWTVKVINTGNSASNPGYFHVQSSGNTTAPGAPTGLMATPVDACNEHFNVDWTNPSDSFGPRGRVVETRFGPHLQHGWHLGDFSLTSNPF